MEENGQIYKSGIGFKEFFLKYGIRFLSISVISITIFILVAYFQRVDEKFTYTGISNGLSIGGVIAVVIGLFSIITNLGFFDLIAYNGSRFKSLMQKYEGENYHGVYEYTEAKKEKRKKNRFIFLPYMIVGLILLVSAIIYIYVGGQSYS